MGTLTLGTKHIGMKALADRNKGYLAIDGESFWDIMKDDKYSVEDIKSLATHIKEKRPCLAKTIARLDAAGKELLDTGRLTHEIDLKTMGSNIQRAIQADQAEAAHDGSIWASMEWKWQEIQ